MPKIAAGGEVRAAIVSPFSSGEKVGGIAVHIGARIVSKANPYEVPVSSTVKDLVIGSGLQFESRGVYSLKGLPGEWNLLALC